MERLIQLGVILLFLGIILIAAGGLKDGKNVKAAGGIFIGPFPVIGFFSDKRMFYILLVLAICFFIFFLLFSKFFKGS